MRRVFLVAVVVVLSAAFSGAAALKDSEGGTRADIPTLEAELASAIGAKQYADAAGILDQLAKTGELTAFGAIIKHALKGVDYGLEKYAGYLVVSSTSTAVHQEVQRLSRKHRNFKTRIVLAGVLARWAKRDDTALGALHEMLHDGSKPVVLSALSWLKKLRRPESVEPLIAALESRERRQRGSLGADRIYFDTLGALEALTEKKLRSAADWKNYWQAQKEGRVKSKRNRKPGRTSAYVGPQFFEIPVNSDRVLFVIDVSHSMLKEDPVLPEDEGVEGRRGKTIVSSRGGGASVAPLTRVRLARVKRELIRVVQGLQSNVRFGIMAFSHELSFWRGSPVLRDADPKNKADAVEWVRRLRADGYTRTDLALQHALGLRDVDTVCLLTDGAPQDRNNARLPPKPIIEAVKAQNRFKKCRIHTVSFAQIRDGAMRYLVRELATQNDGIFRYLK